MISAPVFKTQNYLLNCILPDGKSRAGTDDTTEENHKLHNIIQWDEPCQVIWVSAKHPFHHSGGDAMPKW